MRALTILMTLILLSLGSPVAVYAVTCKNNIPPSNPDSIYTFNSDGSTVTDTRTGLTWKRCSEGQTWNGRTCIGTAGAFFTWARALQHAEQHVFDTHDDWRLPNIKELRSLVEVCRHGPAINDTIFPNTPSLAFWSASPYASHSHFAWYVYFGSGNSSRGFRSGGYRVRLARGGQWFDPSGHTLSVNSTGAPSISITANPSTYGGTTNYTKTNIPNGTQIILTAPATSGSANFSSWTGCDATNAINRTCTVSMTGNKTVTVNYTTAWKTEIGVINPNPAQMSGTLLGFGAGGNQVWTRPVTLAAHGRLELDVTTAAGSDAGSIRSMRLDVTSGQAVGYQKFYQAGQHRVGLEALPRANQSALYLPHIHSDSDWWTGVGLVNTTTGVKNLNFSFSDGVSANKQIGANSHDAFTVETLRGSAPFIGSAQVPNGAGVAGLMLFSSERTLSGVSLSDATTTTLVYPHLEMNGWWTGFVVYNPNPTSADLVSRVYDSAGSLVFQGNDTVQPYKSSVYPLTRGSLPSQASWFTIESTLPVTGFQLFGTEDGNQLAGYSVVDLATTSGIFPKLEKNGWTGIAFVNIGDAPATITLEARNDAGGSAATRTMHLGPKAKEVEIAEDLFPGQNIGTATYIRFTSDQPVVGFQLNGSADRTMLDAIPALGATHVGTQQLYFPHIHAD